MPDASDKYSSTTLWGFATALMMRLGPTTVVVAGFLLLALYSYTEISTVRTESQKELQDSLASAQTHLVANTVKMGAMSEQLMKNIDNMLKLGDKVDKEIQQRRETYEKELELSKQQVAAARAEIVRLTAELTRKQDEFGDLVDQRKRLSFEVSQLRLKKESLTQNRRDLARQVGEFKLPTLADIIRSANETPIAVVEETQDPVSEMRARLAAFLDKPRTPDIGEKIDELIGLPESIFQKAIKVDGAGFSTWFYSVDVSDGTKWITGYGKQQRGSPRDILWVTAEDGVILTVGYVQANFLFKLPRAENWYKRWICDFEIDWKDNVRTAYPNIDLDTWDQISLTSIYRQELEIDSGILFGEPRRFDMVSMDDARKQFPEPYRKWSQGNDPYGRPRLILAMLERAKSFDGAKVPGFGSLEFPPGLEQTTLKVLNASVADDRGTLKNLARPHISRDDWGGIAAVALREALRVDWVEKRQSLDQKAIPAEQYEVLFSFDAIDPMENRRDASLTFQYSGDRWVLNGFEAIF